MYPSEYYIFSFINAGADQVKAGQLPKFMNVYLGFSGKLVGYARKSDDFFKKTVYAKTFDLFLSRYLCRISGQSQLSINGCYPSIEAVSMKTDEKLCIVLHYKKPKQRAVKTLIEQMYDGNKSFNDNFFS